MRVATDNLNSWPLWASTISGSVTEDKTHQRSGAACAACAPAAFNVVQRTLTPVLGRAYFYRVAFRLSALPAANMTIWRAIDSTGTVIELSVTTTGKVEVWNAVAAKHPVETAPTIGAGAYHVAEVMLSIPATGNAHLSWRMDGTTIAAEQEMSCRNLGIKTVQHGVFSAAATPTVYIDDIAVNGGSGSVNNSWVGTASDPIPAPGCLWGADIDGDVYKIGQGDAPYEASTWNTFEEHAGRKVGIVHFSDPWLTWDGFGAGASAACHARGAVPLKTIGGSSTVLEDVISGKEDAAIDTWAKAAAAYGHTVYLRPWHEMNGTWYPWGRSAGYVEAWRHLHGRVKAIAPNVKFVWCPNVIYDAPSREYLESMFPGTAYVDWVGTDGYSGENPVKKYGWKSATELFRETYEVLRSLAPSRPIMICEVGCSEIGGSKSQWIADLLSSALPLNFPQVRAACWFNWNIVANEAGERLDWQIESSTNSKASFKAAIASSWFSPAKPAVTSGVVTDASPKNAVLRGEVIPNGPEATYWFKYWKRGEPGVPLYAPVTKDGDAGDGADAVSVTAHVSGLANTTYEFQIVASNELGESQSTVGSFFAFLKSAFVDERPPMRQYMLATTPGGHVRRWGEDEPDAADILEELTDSDTAPGGNKDLTAALARRPGTDYSDMQPGTRLEVFGAGQRKVSEYRLERVPKTSGDRLVIDPAASGYQVLLSDKEDARAIFLSSDLTEWGDQSIERHLKVIPPTGSYNPAAGQVDIGWQGAGEEKSGILMTLEFQNGSPLAETWFDGNGVPIAHLLYDFFAVGSVNPEDENNFHAQAQITLDDRLDASAVASVDYHFTGNVFEGINGVGSYAVLGLSYTGSYAGVGANSAGWRNVKVLGPEELPVRGYWPDVGIRASDVVAYALERWVPGIHFTPGTYGTLRPSRFLIPHLVFKEPTTVLEMVTQALRFELLEWGVWPGQFGPTFHLNERGRREGAKHWRARVRPAKLSETGVQIDQVYNRVVMSWQDPSGKTRTMGPINSGYPYTDARCEDLDPTNPLNEAGVIRTKHLTMEGMGTVDGAAEQARLFLEKCRLLGGSGEATITDYVEDEHGIEWPYYCVHACDTIEFIDASDRSPRYIVEATRSRKSRSVNIKLDAPPDSYEAILAELRVRETAAGF